MDITIVIVIAVVAIIAIALIFALKGRKETPKAPPAPAPVSHGHGNGVIDEAATAVEDVVGPLVGIDIHPDIPGAPADDLTVLKGLGPKAAVQLQALGICRYAQIANWSADDIADVDSRMGVFKGRIVRDRWVEQARYLAAGDRAGFEAQFGKLGG